MSSAFWTNLTGTAAGDDGVPLACGDLHAEAELAVGTPRKSPLDLAILTVRGADAHDFLHAQLAADLRKLASGDAVLTAWCSPQGRVLFAPWVLAADDGYFLLADHSQAADLERRLRLFVLRSRVEVEHLDHGWAGIRTVAAASVPRDGAQLARAGEIAWYVGEEEAIARCWQTLELAATGSAAARLDDIRRHRPRLCTATADQFLPQELDLDQGAGVSFDKGCYPGQEIVARVRYRGNVKRRLAHLAAATALAPGERLVACSDGAPRGTVIDAAAAASGWECLAVLDLAHSGDVAPASAPASPCRRLDTASTVAD